MPKSRTELVRRAWVLLFKPAEGEEPPASDLNLINALVVPVVAQLATSRIVAIGNPDEIDDHIFLPVAAYLANEAAPEFAQSKSVEAQAIAERDISRATAIGPAGSALETAYF